MSAKRAPAAAYLAKVRRKPAKSEHALQSAIVTWCRGIGHGYVRERFAATPNGAYLGGGGVGARVNQMRKLKEEGLRPGMPDLMFWRGIPGPTGLWAIEPRVLFLEVKNGTSGKVSDSQKEVHASLTECGFSVLVARDLAEAIEMIIKFYTSK